MSLILDALKKIEQERVRRQVRSLELGPELVKDYARPSRTPWRFVILITVVVLTTASITAVTIIKLSSKPKIPSLSSEIPAQKAESHVTPAPMDTVPVASAPPPVSVRPVVSPPTSPPKTTSPPPPPQAELAEGTGSPELTVSGIAWQDDRNDRRAVVNGVLVSEGSVIAGARIREILPDKVRFTIGSRTIEVTNSSPLH